MQSVSVKSDSLERQAILESEQKQREKLKVVRNAFNMIIKVGLAQFVRAVARAMYCIGSSPITTSSLY